MYVTARPVAVDHLTHCTVEVSYIKKIFRHGLFVLHGTLAVKTLLWNFECGIFIISMISLHLKDFISLDI